MSPTGDEGQYTVGKVMVLYGLRTVQLSGVRPSPHRGCGLCHLQFALEYCECVCPYTWCNLPSWHHIILASVLFHQKQKEPKATIFRFSKNLCRWLQLTLYNICVPHEFIFELWMLITARKWSRVYAAINCAIRLKAYGSLCAMRQSRRPRPQWITCSFVQISPPALMGFLSFCCIIPIFLQGSFHRRSLSEKNQCSTVQLAALHSKVRR